MKVWKQYRKKEKITVCLAWGIVLLSWLYLLIQYPELPDRIPRHFGFWGEPDAWGAKGFIWIMAVIQAVLVAIDHAALHESIKNAKKTGISDLTGRDAMAWTCPFISGLFGWVLFAGTYWMRLGKGFIFVVMGLLAVLIVYIIVKSRKRAPQIGKEAEDFYKKEFAEVQGGGETEDLVFKGKIAVWMWGILIVINAGMIVSGITSDRMSDRLPVFGILAAIDLFMVPMYFRNYVILKKEELVIVFGIIKKRIAYENITVLQETHNPLSSLAMSLDRIYIYTISGDDVMISVKKKKELIREVYQRKRRKMEKSL